MSTSRPNITKEVILILTTTGIVNIRKKDRKVTRYSYMEVSHIL